jgi:glycosyltransferase involved in cell wall biosynthesis
LKPERLLLTTDAVGGVWRYSLELATGLALLKVRVVLAVLGPAPSQAQQAAARAIPGLQLHITDLPLDWTAADPAALQATSRSLAALAAEHEVHGVQLHAPALLGSADWHAPVVAVVHSCVGTWWQAVHGGPMPEGLRWRAAATAAGMRSADAVIAPTAAFAAALHRAYGSIRPIKVVHNGRRPIDGGLVPRERGVLTAGRLWDAGKNIAALDRAAAMLDVPVLAAGPRAGPGAEAPPLPHIRALGELDEAAMARTFASWTVFAAPSRYEPFGLAVLEAAQSGMALVLSDIPSFRELWQGAALFVDPDDPEAFAASLQRALDDWHQLGGRAWAEAAGYSPTRMARETLDVHAELQPRVDSLKQDRRSRRGAA